MESSLRTEFQPKNSGSTVSDAEFNLFHNIDRLLYKRLIANLGRDPKESMQIMAFWLWMEQDVVDDLTLVNRMLSLPSSLLGKIIDETVMCLRCAESDVFPFQETNQQLLFLPNFVRRNINFKYFYDNRIGVLKGVTRLATQVCSRAFRDILEQSTRRPGFLPVVSMGLSSGTIKAEKASHGGVQNVGPSLMVTKGGEISPFHRIEVGSSSNVGEGSSMVIHQNPLNQLLLPYYHVQPQPMQQVLPPMDGAFINARPQGLLGENFFQGYGVEPTEKQDGSFINAAAQGLPPETLFQVYGTGPSAKQDGAFINAAPQGLPGETFFQGFGTGPTEDQDGSLINAVPQGLPRENFFQVYSTGPTEKQDGGFINAAPQGLPPETFLQVYGSGPTEKQDGAFINAAPHGLPTETLFQGYGTGPTEKQDGAFINATPQALPSETLFQGYGTGPTEKQDAFINAAPQGLPPETFFQGYGTGPTEKQDADLDDFSHVFKNSLNLIEEEDDGPDERTIFLTFSKGYPISATEVKDFFTKKFGDFIEAIHMQEVPPDEQVLFARVVARSTAFVDAVVDGGKAKYNINGKHVWARKYVKKQTPIPSDAGPSYIQQ